MDDAVSQFSGVNTAASRRTNAIQVNITDVIRPDRQPTSMNRIATAAAAFATAAARLPSQALLLLIWFYQRTLSPVLPIVLGPSCGCRFAPSCSHYAADAVRIHGAFFGTYLAARRLIKCTPLHPGGFDPVPPARRASPVCRRSTSFSPNNSGSPHRLSLTT